MAHHLSLASEIAKANKLRPPSTSQYESLFSKAVQLGRYDLAIKSDPQDIATILARAQLFHAHGFYAEALEDARRAGRIDRRAPHVRYAMAYYYAAAGDSEKGTEFNVSTRKFRNRHRSGTIDQLANFDRRVRENPGDLSELRARAKFLLGQEQVSLAVEDIDRALAKEPNAIPTQLLKIDALQMSNETTAARKLIRQLAGAHDDNNDVLQKVGEVQMEDGFFEDAIVTFDKILARSPTYEAARNARALCYKRLQKQPPVAALPTATKPVSKP
jgi:tetratricopeptide (TPR) repeat protein